MTRLDPEVLDRRSDYRRDVNEEFADVIEMVPEYVTDLSRSGVFLRSASPLPVGTHVRLKFTILADDLETIEGVGLVVRSVPEGELPGMGIAFSGLTSASRATLERILSSPARDPQKSIE